MLHFCGSVRIPIPEQCQQKTGNSEYGDNYKQWSNSFDSRSFAPELDQPDNVWKKRVKQIQLYRALSSIKYKKWRIIINNMYVCTLNAVFLQQRTQIWSTPILRLYTTSWKVTTTTLCYIICFYGIFFQ